MRDWAARRLLERLATSIAGHASPVPTTSSPRGLVLRGLVRPGAGRPVVPDGVVLIGADGLVAAVGPAPVVPVPPDLPVLGGPGAAVLPGLVDAHVRLAFAGTGGPGPDGWRAGLLAAGVVGVRDLGAPLRQAQSWRSAGDLPRRRTALLRHRPGQHRHPPRRGAAGAGPAGGRRTGSGGGTRCGQPPAGPLGRARRPAARGPPGGGAGARRRPAGRPARRLRGPPPLLAVVAGTWSSYAGPAGARRPAVLGDATAPGDPA